MKLLLIIAGIFLPFFENHSMTMRKELPAFYYKIQDYRLQVLQIKNDKTFAWTSVLLPSVDSRELHSQGIIISETDSVLTFKNKFLDRSKLIVVEEKKEIPEIANTRKSIIVKIEKQDIGKLAGIDYDEFNKPFGSNLFLCVFNKNGLIRYKQYDEHRNTFGIIYYDTEPHGFFLKAGSQIVSDTYYIKKPPESNYFKISIKAGLENNQFVDNYLNGASYTMKDSFLINSIALDTFKLYEKNLASYDMIKRTTIIYKDILKRKHPDFYKLYYSDSKND
jgi:hypothetical protein